MISHLQEPIRENTPTMPDCTNENVQTTKIAINAKNRILSKMVGF
jgi:hypothetical protein